MLTDPQRSQIKSLLQSSQWPAAQDLANEICDRLSSNSKVRDSEWETLKTALVEEGMVRGIRNFIDELYKQAQ